ncbi:MAG: hypothetical protein L3J28_08085 [Candidatus Polarisedimenticolaceae bacterium]|nr:hypothetical protein [Candidatus Polarisedimenticolaceae bacterium]
MHHGIQQRDLMALIALLFSASLVAEERLDVEGTSIIGSNELPQVLIIVPWKKPGMERLNVPPKMSLVNKTLEPIDRNVFHRDINYHQALNATKTD